MTFIDLKREADLGMSWESLRTMPCFATAHMFCASWNGPRNSVFLKIVSIKTIILLQGL